MATVECVVVSQDRLGEGPCWAPDQDRLFWFDILGRRLHWFEPLTGRKGEWPLPVRVSAAAAKAGGGLIGASEAGLVQIDGRTGRTEMLQAMAFPPGFRSNDGKIDPQGRFWWSIMDNKGGAQPGAVYRTDSGGRTRRILEGIHIPNTLAVPAEADALFLSDSKAQVLRRYALDYEGTPGPPTVFADLSGEAGTPDGGAFDAEGFLWNAQWGAWRVVRYAPSGRIDRIVDMPVEQPTSCAFGGPDLTILYVTSATDGLDAHALAEQPLAGALFAIEPGVRGLALPAFRM